MAPPFLGTLMSPQNPAMRGGGVDVPPEGTDRGRGEGNGSGKGFSNDITPFSLICRRVRYGNRITNALLEATYMPDKE